MQKNLRRTLANSMSLDRDILKAVALMLYARHRMRGGSEIPRYTTNRLVTLTGAHASTVRKRVATLTDYGLVRAVNGCLIFASLTSSHKKRNIRLSKISYRSLKDVERSLEAILLAQIQIRKDFARRTIQRAHDGKTYNSVKSAQKLCRKYGYGSEYTERGLSYKGIARAMGVSVGKALQIVSYAVKRKIVSKFNHFAYTFLKGINGREAYDYEYGRAYTFTTQNYGYHVTPNTYTVAPVLTHGIIRC